MRRLLKYPAEVYTGAELDRLEMWISIYEKPQIPCGIAGGAMLLLGIGAIVAEISIGLNLPLPEEGLLGKLFWASVLAAFLTGAATHMRARFVFAWFDKEYFRRTGITEAEFLEGEFPDSPDAVSLAFTELETFRYRPEDQQDALAVFAQERAERRRSSRRARRPRAYIARELGLRM